LPYRRYQADDRHYEYRENAPQWIIVRTKKVRISQTLLLSGAVKPKKLLVREINSRLSSRFYCISASKKQIGLLWPKD
jgi:hypothetical protein